MKVTGRGRPRGLAISTEMLATTSPAQGEPQAPISVFLGSSAWQLLTTDGILVGDHEQVVSCTVVPA